MKSPQTIYIALGSNLGDRPENLSRAVNAISEKVVITLRSSIYETPPWGVVDQPIFLNQVIAGSTFLSPHRLLDFLKRIEKYLGREPSLRYGPRLIDLDILLYSSRIISSSRLQIPHPLMHERAFVLVPLAEIEPGLVIPGLNKPVRTLIQFLDTSGIKKVEKTVT